MSNPKRAMTKAVEDQIEIAANLLTRAEQKMAIGHVDGLALLGVCHCLFQVVQTQQVQIAQLQDRDEYIEDVTIRKTGRRRQ